jgi:hypothetical protein
MTDKRRKIETLITQVMKDLDPTGINAAKYQNMFVKMSDSQFSQWVTRFLADEKSNLRLDIEEFDSKRVLQFENVEKAANRLGVKLFEYVYMPFASSDPNRPIRTKSPVLVGYLNIKRPQQLVSKKTGLALSDTNRDEMTGVAKGESKGGTTTGLETEMLAGVDADEILSEFCGVRGDNQAEYDNMMSEIAATGSVKLSDIKTTIFDKPTLLKADMYLIAMGLKTDLVSESYYSVDKIRRAMDQAL